MGHEYHEVSEELRLVSNWNRWYNFIVGGLHAQTITNDRIAESIRSYQTYINNGATVDAETNSAFGQITLKPIDKWELDGGLRYTHVSRDYTSILILNNFLIPGSQGEQLQSLPSSLTQYTEHDVSPEATLSYRPADDLTAFISYKQGYKGPGNNSPLTVAPVLTPETFEAAVGGLPFVHGEKAKGFEGGVKAQLLDRHLAVIATGYRYNYDNEQVSFSTNHGNSAIVANAASARVQGVELGGDYSPQATPGLTLSAFVNYNETYYLRFPNAPCYLGQSPDFCIDGEQDLSGKTVSMAPKWSGYIGSQYAWNLNDKYTAAIHAKVQYSSSYLSDANLDPLSRQGSYPLVDAGIGVGRSDGQWELALLCRDCTNKVYIVKGEDGNAIPSAAIVNAPDRCRFTCSLR
jgi:outer membrane receptor protein involved in Fe transport